MHNLIKGGDVTIAFLESTLFISIFGICRQIYNFSHLFVIIENILYFVFSYIAKTTNLFIPFFSFFTNYMLQHE